MGTLAASVNLDFSGWPNLRSAELAETRLLDDFSEARYHNGRVDYLEDALAANAYVVGVSITKFIKPEHLRTYTELGFETGVEAVLDTGITYDDVETGIVCYYYSYTCSKVANEPSTNSV